MRVKQVAVFRPTPIVVPHVPVTQQVLERKPRVARTCANAAVGDGRLAHADSFFANVNRLELIAGLERPVVSHRGQPGYARCAVTIMPGGAITLPVNSSGLRTSTTPRDP
jgi:hypothetical protein